MATPGWIAALCSHRPTRRQVARALSSGGFELRFFETVQEATAELGQPGQLPPALALIDADSIEKAVVETTLASLQVSKQRIPVVLVSLADDKSALLDLLQAHEIGNLIAKHGAIRAAHPVLDERELLVTCMKVVQNDIFGIDKYIGGWGIDLRSRTVTSMADKRSVCDEFEGFLAELDAPKAVVPNLVIGAEELILNAMVHAPHDPDGRPRYEDIGPVANLTMQPGEEVTVTWGCDGQRLMLSVVDNFGRLDKRTVFEYVARSFSSEKLVPETKISGAGLGLSMAFMSIHQLVFNVWDTRRTEVIAGWYLRVANAVEFRTVGKSLNLFWLPADIAQPLARQPMPPQSRPAPPATVSPEAAIVRITGRIDETTDLSSLVREPTVDLREMNAITSRGLARWLAALKARATPVKLVGLPDTLVKLSSEVEGLLDHCSVLSLALPWECESCDEAQVAVTALNKVDLTVPRRCAYCGTQLVFSGVPEAYQRLIDAQRSAP